MPGFANRTDHVPDDKLARSYQIAVKELTSLLASKLVAGLLERYSQRTFKGDRDLPEDSSEFAARANQGRGESSPGAAGRRDRGD